MPDLGCAHAHGAAYVDGACVLCGARRPHGGSRSAQRALSEVFAMGRQAAGGEPAPLPTWLRSDGRLKLEYRDPAPYRRPLPERRPEPAARAEVDPAEHARVLEAEVCRRSLAEFVRAAWRVVEPAAPLDWGWHLDAVCAHLQATRDGRVQNLAINVPPRTSKTLLTCVFFPAWVWLTDPAWSVTCLSMNPRVAETAAVRCRLLIESAWYRETFRPAWSLDPTIDARSWYANSVGGYRRSFGLAANIVGQDAHAIILDDPNDPKDGRDKMEKVRDAWDLAIGNRLKDLRTGTRILIQQRLDEGDLTGHVLGQGGWCHLRIPLLAEASDCQCATCRAGETAIGWRDPRAEGEVLQPSRWPASLVASERARLGDYGFAGQMQQRPAPAGGAVFRREWFPVVGEAEVPARFERVAVFCDLTSGAKTVGTSRNGFLVVGARGSKRWVLESLAQAGDGVWIEATIARLHAKYPRASFVVERKAAGGMVVAQLHHRIPGMVEWDPGSSSKLERALSVQAYAQAGDVSLVAGPWVDEFLHEATTFPAGRHDDQVDCLTMMLIHWRDGRDWSGLV